MSLSTTLIIGTIIFAVIALRLYFPPTSPASYTPRGFGDRPATPVTEHMSRIRNGR